MALINSVIERDCPPIHTPSVFLIILKQSAYVTFVCILYAGDEIKHDLYFSELSSILNLINVVNFVFLLLRSVV